MGDRQERRATPADAGELIKVLLDQPWHRDCECIEVDGDLGRTETQIVYNNGKEHRPYLRFSKGPKQGFFWDVYGDDFLNTELAVVALSKAPAPVDVSPITFRIPLPQKNVNE